MEIKIKKKMWSLLLDIYLMTVESRFYSRPIIHSMMDTVLQTNSAKFG